MKSAYCLLIVLIVFPQLWLNAQDEQYYVDDRDGNNYETTVIDGLLWFKENLRFRSEMASDTLIEVKNCGVFYPISVAQNVCPNGWRLPEEKEVSKLIKKDKKGIFVLSDTLNIELCGRIDNEKHSRVGEQNTFWLQAELEDGHIAHWHTFQEEHKIHSHNVVVARRKFPIRCLKDLNPE